MLLDKEVIAYPETSFIVFSDPHIYDPSLGTEGKAFEDYLTRDRKLLRESTEILGSAIGAIKEIDADFIIVPGDLTKDGEQVSHQLVTSYLGQLEDSGKQVFVVPGNHDINNGSSHKYVDDRAERVPNVTPEEFALIYDEFGYKQALMRDPSSLSYIAEPQPGLWLLALDSCCYADNIKDQEPITDGKFSPATLQWIEDRLAEAITNKKAVIAFAHHGIMEHYIGQQKNFGEYIVDDYQTISRLLAMYNARLAFTGHYHAQDISVMRWHETNKFVFDVETGSLVTYPCPYRLVDIDTSQKATIGSYLVESINSHPTNFQEYAREYTMNGIKSIAAHIIQGYKVQPDEAEELAGQVAEAFVAHYAGDETLPAGSEAISTRGLSLPGWLVATTRKNLVQGLWNDLEPADNNINIDLKSGRWEKGMNKEN